MRSIGQKCAWDRSAWFAIGLLVGATSELPAQVPIPEPAVFIEMQIQNGVTYWDDVADPSKVAISPGVAAPAVRNFMRWIAIGDIVSVNGKPVKGTEVVRVTAINLTTRPDPSHCGHRW